MKAKHSAGKEAFVTSMLDKKGHFCDNSLKGNIWITANKKNMTTHE